MKSPLCRHLQELFYSLSGKRKKHSKKFRILAALENIYKRQQEIPPSFRRETPANKKKHNQTLA